MKSNVYVYVYAICVYAYTHVCALALGCVYRETKRGHHNILWSRRLGIYKTCYLLLGCWDLNSAHHDSTVNGKLCFLCGYLFATANPYTGAHKCPHWNPRTSHPISEIQAHKLIHLKYSGWNHYSDIASYSQTRAPRMNPSTPRSVLKICISICSASSQGSTH